MKARTACFVFLSGVLLAIFIAAIQYTPVLAETCYNGQIPVPCPPTKGATPVQPSLPPSFTPTLTPTDTGTPSPTPTFTPTGTATETPTLTPTLQAPISPIAGPPNTGPGQPVTNPNPSPVNSSLFAIGGGLFIGLLLGGFVGFRLGVLSVREAAVKPDSAVKVGGIYVSDSATGKGSYYVDEAGVISTGHGRPGAAGGAPSIGEDSGSKGTPRVGPISSAMKPDSAIKAGGIYISDSTGTAGGDDFISPKIGPKHDDPTPPPETGAFLGDSTDLISTKIGPKHDDPTPPPDSDAPDVERDDTDQDAHLDLDISKD